MSGWPRTTPILRLRSGVLGDAALGAEHDQPVRALFTDPTAFDAWAVKWRERIAGEGQQANARRDAMRLVNPAFIPRNHLIEEVIRAAVDKADFAPFERLIDRVG